ncbi:DUF2997 domain-containing protein [Candidatus Laterigemmans baculatus]|uniref:DUF2997 domain-containing protein n=1 Tax=Candidatus Laterigemmans baculatus TaxID=2770505 RepID=UPI0013DCFAA6|nr:DUF2997 domain-containing protein [Candidatus Laterigemmans baculatus]
MKTIEIIVAPDGSSRLETKGFSGSECREASRLLEQAIGAKESDTPTAEMHQAASQANQQHHRQ